MSNPSKRPTKSLFSSGELLTLLGVVVAVLSASQTWKVDKLGDALPPETGLSTYVNTRFTATRSAFDLFLGPVRIGWLLVFCAVVCGLLLLFEPNEAQKKRFLSLHVALTLLFLALTAAKFSLTVGVLMALGAVILLLAGAFLRYR